MRRFVAYLLASVTIFLGVGVTFKPVATSINPDLSYRKGQAITFRISHEDEETEEVSEEELLDYAQIAEDRLKAFDVTDYKIEVRKAMTKDDTHDTFTITCTANNTDEYDYISKIICANPKISFATAKGEAQVIEEDFSWHENDATIEYDGNASVLVLKIPDKAKTKVDALIEEAKKEEGEEPEPETNEGEETKPSIVMWLNYEEGDDYEKREEDINIKNKIFNECRSDSFYHGSETTAIQIRYEPAGASKFEIQAAYRKALCACNILNAEETEFKCVKLGSEIVDPSIEELIYYGSHAELAMSATLISLMVSYAVTALILAIFCRITSIAILASATLSTFLTFGLFVFFKPLFNVGALVGLLIVMGTGLFSGLAHNHYLHEEVYKGRSLKKANYEASKKTTLLTVDSSVILALLGIFIYFIGGSTVASLGAVLIFGAALNVLVNTFVLKGLMWLVTNNTKTQDQLKMFGINKKHVPNLAKEEKPTYFGPYTRYNFAKKSKLTGVIAGAILLAGSVGMITFKAVNGNMFNAGDYFVTKNEFCISSTTSVNESDPIGSLDTFKADVLNKITINGTDKRLGYIDDISHYEYQYHDSSKEDDHVIHYNIVTITSDINATYSYSYKDTSKEPKIGELFEVFETAIQDNYGTVFDNFTQREVQAFDLPSNAGFILLANVMAVTISALYLWIRYRASRAVTTLIIGASSALITIGAMSLLRITATPVMAVAASLVTMFSLLYSLYILHKDKDLIRDERIRDYDTRKSTLIKAHQMATEPAINLTAVFICTMVICFGFGPHQFIAIFLSAFIGGLVSVAMNLFLFTSVTQYFEKQISQIKLPEIKLRKKKVVVKDNELSEAIFIGIND
ncbi:MAG: hypothetical protein MJ207_03935 [Bacilli bacterium]|nr:hypothetical protein [Bacilli bacterium]